MAYRASAYCSSSDDETPSIQACSTTETSTFEITPCASASSVTEEQLKDHLLHMGQEGVCCCVSAEEITADQMDHPLVGWERRSIEGSKHSTWSQISFSEVSLSPAVDSTSQLYKPSACSEKSSRSTLSSRGAVSLGSEPKSQLRKYIHSALPDIPYIFRHHDVSDGDVSQYIEDYKCCYTYPGIEEKSRRVNIIHPSSSTTAVKPTLFVLGGDLTFQHKVKFEHYTENGDIAFLFTSIK